MSNSDYSVRGTGSFTTTAALASAVTPASTTFTLTGLQSVGPGDRFVGMAVLVGDEIVKLLGFDVDGNIIVGRGCADTIPAAHAAGTLVWFFERTMATDGREYFGTDTIGVKVLVSTTSRTMAIENSPPQTVTFGQRFIRPYPPGLLRANSVAWTTAQRLTAAAPNLTLTWNHRNRVSQMDVLVPHFEASVTPEVGTTYRLRLFTTGGTLVRTISGITGTTYTYTRGDATSDFGLGAFSDTGDYAAYALFDTQRDGYSSLQAYRIDFAVDTTGLVAVSRLLLESGDRLLLESGDFIRLEA